MRVPTKTTAKVQSRRAQAPNRWVALVDGMDSETECPEHDKEDHKDPGPVDAVGRGGGKERKRSMLGRASEAKEVGKGKIEYEQT